MSFNKKNMTEEDIKTKLIDKEENRVGGTERLVLRPWKIEDAPAL